MTLFLTSILRTHFYGDDGERIPVALDDENGILSQIRKRLNRTEDLVLVANDPADADDNDAKLSVIGESFRLTGLDFDNYTVLDDRNKKSAHKIVSGADIVILSGGKCVCQNAFFANIGLRSILKNYDGIVIGISAGSMNMCETVANFPEEPADIPEPRWFSGMGFVDDIIIPHFDGSTETYQFPCADFDIAKDYIMPMSFGYELTGLPNGAYIIVESDGRKEYCGDVYSIYNGKSTKR